MNLDFSFENERNAFEKAVQKLRTAVPHEVSLITLSEHGVYICDNSKKVHIEAHKREITDVSGAGDTVIVVATFMPSFRGTIGGYCADFQYRRWHGM